MVKNNIFALSTLVSLKPENMEPKKTKKADLERKRTLFFEIGMVAVLAIVLVAFEWKTYEKIEYNLGEQTVEKIEEEMIPVTRQQEKPPPPPPPKTTEIEVVEDDEEIEEEIEIDAEADQETFVEEYVAPEIEEEEEVEELPIFTVVEEQPEFPGGFAALTKYLQSNIQYPQMAREVGVSGIVYVTFVVEPDGSITNVQLLRGIGSGCDEEALRVVKRMPNWKPGKQRGKSVRVQFNLPVKFTLEG